MHIETREKEQLLKGYRIVLIIWVAILASLPIYLVVCTAVRDQLQSSVDSNTFEILKYALWGVSAFTLIGAHFLRKLLLRASTGTGIQTTSPQHPAVAKYTVAIIITMALLESIGIYGVVLYFIGMDTSSLQQLLIVSAIAMFFYRPRKEELFNLAVQMKG